MEVHEFMARQKWSYEMKVYHAINIARSFYDKIIGEYRGECHVSVGGLDSITLLLFIRKYVDKDIKAVSVSSLEDKSIQAIHKQLGIEVIKPYKSKVQVIRELGYPIISKSKAAKI